MNYCPGSEIKQLRNCQGNLTKLIKYGALNYYKLINAVWIFINKKKNS